MTLGSFFTTIFNAIHKGAKAASAEIAKIDTPGNEAVVEGLTTLIDPAAAAAETAAFSVLGTAAAAVNSVDQADLANGINVQLDSVAATAVKALISQTGAAAKAIAAGVK